MVNWFRPTSATKIRSFLELAGYFRNFVKDFVTLKSVLATYTRESNLIGHQLVKSFQVLKQRLVSAPILTLPRESGDYIIHSDASKHGLGCGLMQEGQVITYASR